MPPRRSVFPSWRSWIGMAAVAPLAVGTSGEYADSSATRFGLAMGAGDFAVVSRGCNGEMLSKYHRTFRDASASVRHEFRGPLTVGLRGQRVAGVHLQGEKADQMIWNPHVGLEWRMLGFGAGWVTPSGDLEDVADFDVPPVSGHVRIGNPNKLHFSARLMEAEPYFSSGGALEARLGARLGSRVRPWLGIGGAVPYDAAGVLVGADVRIARQMDVSLGLRLGSSEGLEENAIRAGLSYTWTHQRYGPQPDVP